MVSMLAVAAASWGVVMAVSPLLQIRRMVTTGSSTDVSLGYLAVLQPGFGLWVAYGLAIGDLALVIPNALAFLVGMTTIAAAVHYRQAGRAPLDTVTGTDDPARASGTARRR